MTLELEFVDVDLDTAGPVFGVMYSSDISRPCMKELGFILAAFSMVGARSMFKVHSEFVVPRNL